MGRTREIRTGRPRPEEPKPCGACHPGARSQPGTGRPSPGPLGSPMLKRSHGESFRPFSTPISQAPPQQGHAERGRAGAGFPGGSGSAARDLRRLRSHPAVGAGLQRRGQAALHGRGTDLRALTRRPGGIADPGSEQDSPAAHRGGTPGRRRRLHRGHGHRGHPVHAPPAGPHRKAVRGRDRAAAGGEGLRGERRRPARSRGAGHGPDRERRQPGGGPGLGRDEGGERRKSVAPATTDHPGRRGRSARAVHRCDGAGGQAAATPDTQPGPGRDDPDVRAPRHGAPLRSGRGTHRGRRRAADAGERRSQTPAGAAPRRRGAARLGAAGPRSRDEGAARLRARGHRRGAPRGRAAARGQPTAHGLRRRPRGNGGDTARLHRAAGGDRQGGGGTGAAQAAVRRRTPHRYHPGRAAHRRRVGAGPDSSLRGLRHRGPGRRRPARRGAGPHGDGHATRGRVRH
ncbi:hypothetical protein SVIOM74S_03341 [Streptomyces violarus]